MGRKAKPDPKKYCRYCGRRMHRKRYGGQLEAMIWFRRRNYCDRLCMARGMIKNDVSKATHHWRARRHAKDVCERCGSRVRLHVHHKDRDFRNDDPANLETICERCHGKEHGDQRGRLFRKRIWVVKTDFEELCDLLRASLLTHPDPAAVERILHDVGHGE